jgi:hypothetical protein
MPRGGATGSREPELRAGGDVAVDELALHGEVECGADDHVHFEDGLGGEPVASASAGRGELVV